LETEVQPARDRLEVFGRLCELRREATLVGETRLVGRIEADLAYLRALLGERMPLDAYVRATQGCGAAGWTDAHVTASGDLARDRLASLGIAWGVETDSSLAEAEGRLGVEEAPDAIRRAVAELEPAVRRLTGANATYELAIEAADVDAYWSYWLDGVAQYVRLRLNVRRAQFTMTQVRQFALHEVLGHALQSACLAERCVREEVPWVRLLSVHAPHQVLFEGLAQALPLVVVPDDEALVARVSLAHYIELVRSELHLAVNSGADIEQCVLHARTRVPFWGEKEIADALTNRGVDPLLRTYLWSYPAGLDWFVALAGASCAVTSEVLHAAYRDPLTPDDLTAIWPEGPPIGGSGGAVRLRNSPLP
jgi:hypothetical protein